MVCLLRLVEFLRRVTNLFDISAGTGDPRKRGEGSRITLRFSVLNVTNRQSLYNFLSTSSGTHFVGPRTYQAHIGYVF